MSRPWCDERIGAIDETAMAAASARQRELTKPPGSLGRLETLAIRLAGMQGSACPRIERVHMTVFAADHGVAAEGVSAFPRKRYSERTFPACPSRARIRPPLARRRIRDDARRMTHLLARACGGVAGRLRVPGRLLPAIGPVPDELLAVEAAL